MAAAAAGNVCTKIGFPLLLLFLLLLLLLRQSCRCQQTDIIVTDDPIKAVLLSNFYTANCTVSTTSVISPQGKQQQQQQQQQANHHNNNNKFVHMQLDRRTGKLYVGGINRLLQLDAQLKLEACISTGPKKDSPDCHATGCNSPPGATELRLTDNVNKLLIIDTESGKLIACGSLFQGSCERYRLANISASAAASEFLAVAVVANDEHSSTYGFIGPEHYNQWGSSNILYVGTTFTGSGAFRDDVPAITSRNLDNLEVAEYSFSKQSMIRIDVKYRDHFLVKYVYGFNYSDYAYFLTVQKQSYLPGQEEFGFISRVARVCINDANYDSYTEVTLKCLVKGIGGGHDNNSSGGSQPTTVTNYNLIQDAKLAPIGEELALHFGIQPGQMALFAAFSPSRGITNEPQSKSALCVYSMEDIETKFNDNIHMCFNGSIKYRNMPYISGLILSGNCPAAGTTGTISNFCEVGLRISGVVPVSADSAIHFSDTMVTSIAVTTTEKNTVCFLGTSKGTLKKVLLLSPYEGIEYESLVVDPNNTVLPDTAVSPENEYIYVLTASQVMKIRIENCGKYTNCSMCLEAKDPYCGWCSLERRCTVRSACQKASHSSPRWLSFGTGQQCIDFEQVLPDRIPINQVTTVQLTIRTLPELPYGAKYRCVFGGAEPIDAGVVSFGLTCPTPAISLRPKIPEHQDHVYVPLSVRSSETMKDFVSRNFAYFDCSAHTKCFDCVTSNWACNWCIYENKCTHNVSHCQANVISGENNPTHLSMHGRNSCPKFIKPAERILIPNGVLKEIAIELQNMPHPLPEHFGFLCIVDVEGASMMVPALVHQDRIIVCGKTLYSYQEAKGEYEASVTVVWNRNHYIDTMNVTIYKCNILGSYREHPDCSLCITRHVKYHCAWCHNECKYADSCNQPFTSECPKPRIDMIKPLSGPVEGGTLVTIEGSNLGLKEEDVRNKINIGGTPCILVDYQISVRISCRTGFSPNKKVAKVVIGNTAGFTESAVHFSYEDIVLNAITPSIGPVSGGTQLAITGENLNIGSHTAALLDDLTCLINSTQATSSRITCITPKVTSSRNVSTFTLMIDGANRSLIMNPFVYKPDPTIAEIKPLISFASGGRMIRVHGTNFDIIQKPEMVVYDTDFRFPVNKTDCLVLNPTQMDCPSPAANYLLEKFIDNPHRRQRRHQRTQRMLGGRNTISIQLKVGFIMDNVESVADLEKHQAELPSAMTYVPDPRYTRFPNEVKQYKGETLVIEGENLNLASDTSDVIISIGTEPCNITSLANVQLFCTPPVTQPSPTDDSNTATYLDLPLVVVKVGRNLRYQIGYIQYEVIDRNYLFPAEAVAGIITAVVTVLILFGIILSVLRRRSSQAEREYKRIQIQMDTLESNVRLECKQAFAELQTDMTDLTADLGVTGMPTLDHNEYIMKVFFPGVRDHPVLTDPKSGKNDIVLARQFRLNIPRSTYDSAMIEFRSLLLNRYFLCAFIETLEAQESFDIRDKVNVASLLMVVLLGNMEYATEVLHCLLSRLIDKSVMSRHPHLMLRKTESVVEKMLTNWLSLCMYGYLKDYAGPSLFLLYKAIKYQIEKGPVDAVTHEARYSLSEERLLRQQITHNPVMLQVITDESDEKITCRVLDCDTISQVKSKIMDSLYKNTPFSLRPSIHEVDLEWRHGRGGRLILRDEDVTTKTVSGWRKLNTLAHYAIKDSAVMSLVPMSSPEHFSPTCARPKRTNILNISLMQNITTKITGGTSNIITNSLSPIMSSTNNVNANTTPSPHYYHLVKQPVDDRNYFSSAIFERSHKAIPEIFLTRLLSTKGTIQKFVDDFFTTILTVNEALPIAVKWLFDIFDNAVKRHQITDAEVLYAWKSNSLPLRFWVNFIKNPDFIFDINKTPTVDSCLSVVAQTFMDSCSMTENVLGKDSPSNKLLFAKVIPQYREIVAKFYHDIQKLPEVSNEELKAAMRKLSEMQTDYFHDVSALKELYIYATKYNDEIINMLESDVICKEQKLAQQLETLKITINQNRMAGEGTSSKESIV